MRSAIVSALALAIGLVLGACDRGSSSGGGSTAASSAPASPSEHHVTVMVNDDGFSPSEVKVAKGEKTMLMFKRTSEKTCATAVEFPELQIKKELPLNQVVAIDVPTDQSRTLTFQCGMGMLKSKVVIQ